VARARARANRPDARAVATQSYALVRAYPAHDRGAGNPLGGTDKLRQSPARSAQIAAFVDVGALMIGGCCGTARAHSAALRVALVR
jgi:S-methylmethionine-dependent homocysteine/selenocysteine methylase